jgi:hypothetical protein
MSLGYCFVPYTMPRKDVQKKKKRLLKNVWIREYCTFLYSSYPWRDPVKWNTTGDTSKTLMSILMSINNQPIVFNNHEGTFWLMNAEKRQFVDFFLRFRRVLFFSILHIILIHFIAVFAAEFTGFVMSVSMPKFSYTLKLLKGYGFNFDYGVYI